MAGLSNRLSMIDSAMFLAMIFCEKYLKWQKCICAFCIFKGTFILIFFYYNSDFISFCFISECLMSIYKTLSPYIFRLDAEKAHRFAEWTIKHIVPLPLVQDYVVSQHCVFDERLHMQVAGIRFYNPVGLAAGFDKNATMVRGLSALGFGFVEIGTITQAPQNGNPKPRLFRYTQEKSLQNAMGFNNDGSIEISRRLKKLYPYSIPLGVNVGKNKVITQSDSLKNYENVLLDCLQTGDYFVFNLSSPNTPHLRDLQNVSFVQELFSMARGYTQKPLFLKVSPDMHTDEMLKVVEMSIKCGASGIIATNTTIDYSVLNGAQTSGGISGEALKAKSRATLKILSEAFFGQVALISVGGIDSAQEAYERIKLGASLLQIFSGLVFHGMGLCKQINDGILTYLNEDGFTTLSEAVGVDIKKQPKKRGRKPKSADNMTSVGNITTQAEANIVANAKKAKTTKAKEITTAKAQDAKKDSKIATKSKTTKQKTTQRQTLGQTSDGATPRKRGRKSNAEKARLAALNAADSATFKGDFTESRASKDSTNTTEKDATNQTNKANELSVNAQSTQNTNAIAATDSADSQKE